MAGRYDDEARLREQIGLLVRALRADLETVRESAVVQLSLFGTKAVPHLSSTLLVAIGEKDEMREEGGAYNSGRDSNPERAIEGIVRVLGMIAEPTSAAVLAKALPRPEAALALGKVGTSAALGLLVQEIPQWFMHEERDGESKESPELAKEAFSYFGQEAVTRLGEAMRLGEATRLGEVMSNDLAVSLCACVVFQEAKGASAISGLLNLLESPERRVRTASFQALTKLGSSIPQQFVTRALEGAFKRPSKEEVEVPLERLLDACQEDTLLQFYLGWDWEEPAKSGAYPYTGLSEGQKLMEYHIARNGKDVKSKLVKYIESGTPKQQALAAKLLEKATSFDMRMPTPLETV